MTVSQETLDQAAKDLAATTTTVDKSLDYEEHNVEQFNRYALFEKYVEPLMEDVIALTKALKMDTFIMVEHTRGENSVGVAINQQFVNEYASSRMVRLAVVEGADSLEEIVRKIMRMPSCMELAKFGKDSKETTEVKPTVGIDAPATVQ